TYYHLVNAAEHRRREVTELAEQSRLAQAIKPQADHQRVRHVMQAVGDMLINTGQRIKQAATPNSTGELAHNGVRDTQSMPAV
ncbi:MAG: hypothetical protein CUN56_10315, partial [Phototrophicales bacterium]